MSKYRDFEYWDNRFLISKLLKNRQVLYRENLELKIGWVREVIDKENEIAVKIEPMNSNDLIEISLSQIVELVPEQNPSARNKRIGLNFSEKEYYKLDKRYSILRCPIKLDVRLSKEKGEKNGRR